MIDCKNFPDWLDKELKMNDVTIMHVFRGVWWPLCESNIKGHDKAFGEVNGKTVKIYAIASQDQDKLDKALPKWNLKNTSFIGDPENIISKYLKETYLENLAFGKKKGYPNGMAQPAELIFHKDRVIFDWVILPGLFNFQGALGRPNVKQMWKTIETHIKKEEN